MRLAPEGRPFIAVSVLLVVTSCFIVTQPDMEWTMQALSAFLVVLAVFPLYFFRDPEPERPRRSGTLLSPAHGTVVSVQEEVEPDFIGRRSCRVSILLSVFDVHVQRAPIAGVISYRARRPGRFLSALNPRAPAETASADTGIVAVEGKVLVRQIVGLIARRIVTDHPEGRKLRRGERIGIIRFGSRVDIFFPRHWSPLCHPGERVRAGESPLAVIRHLPFPASGAARGKNDGK